MDDIVFIKGPLVDSTIKISGINLSILDIGQFKKLVESRSNILPDEFDLVYGGRILNDDKSPTEYKIISGTTLFVLKKFIADRNEYVEKTETVRCPEFTELLRHERMQDLIVTVLITDPESVEQLLAENEEDVSSLSQLRTLLRSRHFIGLLRSNTFELFSNSPELLTLGQRIIDKCISDIRSQGQEIPNSDTQLILMLEQYLSVDYMEEEEDDTQQSSQVVENTSNEPAMLPSIVTVPPEQPPPQRVQPQGLFTVEMLTNALQGSATSSPVADPPSYSAEQSRSPPAGNFSHNDIREALAGAYRTPMQSSTNYQPHHHRRSSYETGRRTGHSSTRRDQDHEPYREREQQRERRGSNRRDRQETQRRHHYPELSPDRTTYLRQTYRNELEQLKLLGIQDELLAVQVLQATEGDVNSAVEILLQS
ncbi:uncharacterized protein [Dysidea avara]|uniref:uncharacterized protein isoform X2 n=1 Tax=Dysidea avara TaxID=196820 RepID=UPI0033241820